MVNLSHAIQMDTAHTASISLQKNDFDIDQAVAVISLINQVTSVEALTVFNSLTKILPVDDALNTVNKMKKTYLSKKNYKPYIDSDGRYRCYVYWEEDGKKKRKPIAAKNLMDLEKKALGFYEGLKSASTPTLANLYPVFIKERVEDGVGDSTIRHDQYDWARFLKDDDMVQRSLADISYYEFVSWFKRKLKAGLKNKRTEEIHPYTTKQAKSMRSLLSNLLQFAVDREIIEENFSSKMGRFPYKKYCVEKYKPDSDQVYQDNEPTQIMELAFQKFYETHNFAYLAVIMNFLLDLRVGELVALKFSDTEDKPGQIHIQRQEVENFIIDPNTGIRHRNGFKIADHTKTWEDRFVNLSDVAKQMLHLIKEEQQKLGIESEYLFINKKKERMHACSITKVLYEVLNPGINTSHKSCHKIRKTVTSNLRNALGVAVAARVAGHKNESTTDKHYSYSTVSNEYYQEEYTKVIDEKVPSILKQKCVCSN